MEKIAATGPVTLDDVRQALGETPAASTNAGAVRRLIGRGSLATIQKHLETLRAAAAAPAAPEVADVPSMPAGLVDDLWRGAYNAASVRVLDQMNRITTERDAAAAQLAAAAADVEALTAAADVAEAAAAEAAAQLEVVKTAAEAAIETAAADLLKAKEEAASAATAAAKALSEAQAAHQLAAAHWETERAVLQGTIDRMNSQLAEAKSLIHQRG